ncbi:MAG: PEP-CTERM sorting domain-containing protein, partial [Candidatus Nealsonbacteria bacterium]|nr:PEP-CTERM sorting domain-containing protein [Candidatus Nealsonbacteria bacterium]
NTTSPGELMLASEFGGWDGAANDGLLLYVDVAGDFVTEVQATSGTSGNYNGHGLMARLADPTADGDAGEDWVFLSYSTRFNTNRWRNIDNNGQTNEYSGLPPREFIQLERSGDDFIFRHKAIAGDSWAELHTETRADLNGLPLQVGLWHANFIGGVESGTLDNFSLTTPIIGPPTVKEREWWVNGMGDWNSGGNWAGGGAPNGGDYAVTFGGILDGIDAASANTDVAVTVKDIKFDNPNRYVVGGAGSITMKDTFVEDPGPDEVLSTIEVIQGSHEFQLPVTLANAATVTVADGTTLTFNNALNLGGNTLTKTGAGTMSVNNDLTTGGGGSIIEVAQGSIGGVGTVGGNLVVSPGATVAPGNSTGTLSVDGNLILPDDSIYEWEIGRPGNTDVINVMTGGTMDLDNFVLTILDNDSYVPSVDTQLPVFTYDQATTTPDMTGFDNIASNFDVLDMTGWTVGTLSLIDGGAGTIYLTGLSGGTPSGDGTDWNGGTGLWASSNWSGGVFPDPAANMTIGVTGDPAVVTVDSAATAKSVALSNDAQLIVNATKTLNVTGAVDVGATSTLTVDGTLTAAVGSVVGTLAGSGTLNVDPVTVTGTVAPGGDGIGVLTVGMGELVIDTGATYNAGVSLGDDASTIEADTIILDSGDSAIHLGGTLAPKGVGRTDAGFFSPSTTQTVFENETGADVVTGVAGEFGVEFAAVDPAPADDVTAHIGQGAFLRDVTYDRPGGSIVDSVNLELFVALGGDADGDGKVWLSDWAALRANFGNTGAGKTWTEGNFDPWVDEKVWLSDWAALRANFGNASYVPAGAAAVPEPGTIAMLLGALAGLVLIGRRRRR